MKEGIRVYGKKHERKFYGRLGRKRMRGNLVRHLEVGPTGVPTLDGHALKTRAVG